MAQKTLIQKTCDISGEPADTTVTFAIGGHYYEIDLADEHARILGEAMAPFVAAARPVRPSGSRPRTRSRRAVSMDIRRWARENGISVAERGRISSEVVQRYENRHGMV